MKTINGDGIKEHDTNVSPAGRLEEANGKWKEITDDLYILEVILEGYRLPLKESPPSVLLKNNK